MTKPKIETTADLYVEDAAAFQVLKQKTEVIEGLRTGRAAAGVTKADVFHAGVVALEARVARAWTAEHEALLDAGPGAVAASLIAEAREQGFGPDSPHEVRVAKAVELHGLGVSDARIAELFDVSSEAIRVSRHRAAAVAGDDALAAEAARLAGEGLRGAEIGRRLGISKQKVGYLLGPLQRARSRSESAAPVRHATPVKFKAPAS